MAQHRHLWPTHDLTNGLYLLKSRDQNIFLGEMLSPSAGAVRDTGTGTPPMAARRCSVSRRT